MQRWVQTDRSGALWKLIDQGLPFRFTPLTRDGEIQVVLINRDWQSLEAAPTVGADVVQGVKQRQGCCSCSGSGTGCLSSSSSSRRCWAASLVAGMAEPESSAGHLMEVRASAACLR